MAGNNNIFYDRGWQGSSVPESTPAGICIIFLDPDSKICEKVDL